jgi:hypothetical protein
VDHYLQSAGIIRMRRLQPPAHVLSGTAALALFASCINTNIGGGGTPPPMCETNLDCDHGAGEICDDGICWGAPPEGVTFAAILLPPGGRDDLVPTEISQLSIDREGNVGNLRFADLITVSGRVVLAADPAESVAAQLRVRRPPRIPGGPAYSRTVIANPGAEPGERGFELRLPRLEAGEEPYQIVVLPDDGTLADATTLGIPAELAPPLHLEVSGDADQRKVELVLGDSDQVKAAAGRVVDAAGRGLKGVRVFARGQWDPNGELERVSSTATAGANGEFALFIPRGMAIQKYELVVRPAPGVIAPTLRKPGVEILDPTEPAAEPQTLLDLTMPSHPSGALYKIPIRGPGPSGGIIPSGGAEVRFTTLLLDASEPGNTDGVTAQFTASGVTDNEGQVVLELIPGGTENRLYHVTVQPLATAEHGTVSDLPFLVGPPSPTGDISVLPDIKLSFRVQVSGVLLAQGTEPARGAAIATRASTAFRWGLNLELQSALDDFRFPTSTTGDDGRFVLWLDEQLFGANAAYDIEIFPAAATRAPRWSLHNITLADRSVPQSLDMGMVSLPRASFARGSVVSATGDKVTGAELHVYEISADFEACSGATLPSGMKNCHPPALLRDASRSGDDGRAVIVLPAP